MPRPADSPRAKSCMRLRSGSAADSAQGACPGVVGTVPTLPAPGLTPLGGLALPGVRVERCWVAVGERCWLPGAEIAVARPAPTAMPPPGSALFPVATPPLPCPPPPPTPTPTPPPPQHPPASTATPAMGECGRYRQGCDSESEREHSKHCHVGTAFLRPGIGTRTTERASPLRLAPQREAGIAGTKHHSCHAGLHVASRTGFPYGHRKQ